MGWLACSRRKGSVPMYVCVAEMNAIMISAGGRRRIFLGQAIPATGLKREHIFVS
jgi:hypothetical protein